MAQTIETYYDKQGRKVTRRGWTDEGAAQTKSGGSSASPSSGNGTGSAAGEKKLTVNSYRKEVNDFLKSSKAAFDSMKVGTAKKAYDDYYAKYKELKKPGEAIESYIQENQAALLEELGMEQLEELKGEIASGRKMMQDNLEAFRELKDYMGQFGSDEEEQTFQRHLGYAKKYDAMDAGSLYDAMAALEDGEEKQWIRDNALGLQGFRDTVQGQAEAAEKAHRDYIGGKEYRDAKNARKRQDTRTISPEQYMAMEQNALDLEKKAGFLREMYGSMETARLMENIEEEADKAEREYEEYLHSEEYAAWNLAHLEAKAEQQRIIDTVGIPLGIDPELMRNAKADSLRDRAEHYRRLANTKKDSNTMLKAMEELESWPEQDRYMLETFMMERDREALSMDQDRFLFASAEVNAAPLIEKYGRQKVMQMAESLGRYQNQQNAESVSAWAQERAGAGFLSGAGHSALSVAANLAGSVTAPVGYLKELGQKTGQYSSLDPNSAGMLPNLYAGAVRQTVGGKLEDSLGKGASVIYQAAMSAADNLARIAVTGGYMPGSNGAGSLALAATSGFGQAVSEYSGQGASPAEALAMGVVQGGLEIVTEKISVDNLLEQLGKSIQNPKSFIQIMKAALQSGAVEVTEEEMSFLGGIFAEAAILRGGASWNRRVQELMTWGFPESFAQQQASMMVFNEAKETAVQSFLSGGMMSGATNVVGNIQNARFEKAMAQMEEGTEKKPGALRQAEEKVQDQPAKTAEEETEEREQLRALVVDTMDAVAPRSGYDLNDLDQVERIAANAYSQKRMDQFEYDAIQEYVNQQRQETPQAGQDEAGITGLSDEELEAMALPMPQQERQMPKLTTEQEFAQVNARLEEMSTHGQFDQEYNKLAERWSQLYNQINNQQQGGMSSGTDAGEAVSDGVQTGSAGIRSGEQDGSMGPGTKRRAAGELGHHQRLTQRRAEAKILQQQGRISKVSTKEMGLWGGTENRNVMELPWDSWDSELQKVAEKVNYETGYEVHFILGRMNIRGKDGTVRKVRGVCEGEKIFIQADNTKYTPAQIADHESYHAISRTDRNLNQRIRERIEEAYDTEELSQIFDKYLEAMMGVYADPAQLGEEDFSRIMDMIEEEILADAYAGIGDFDKRVMQYQENAQQEVERTLYPQGRKSQENGTRETRGPDGGRYSIDDNGIELEKPLKDYPYNMQTVIHGYIEAVDEKLLDFLGEVHEGKAWKGKKYTVGTVQERMSEDIKRITGVDMKPGSPVIMNTDAVIHIENRHGENGEHDDSMADPLDVARINYVVQNYDEISEGTRASYGYKNRDNTAAKSLVFSKKINGTYFVVEAVPDTGKAWIVTAYINKNGASQVPDAKTPRLNVRNELASAPKYSIDDPDGDVNDQDEDFGVVTNALLEQNGLRKPKPAESQAAGNEIDPAKIDRELAKQQKMWGESWIKDQYGEEGFAKYQAKKKQAEEAARKQRQSEEAAKRKKKQQERQTRTEQQTRKARAAEEEKQRSITAPVKAKKACRDQMLNLFSVSAGKKREAGQVIDRYLDKMISAGRITDEDYKALFDHLYASGVVTIPADEYYAMGRSALVGGRIYINDSMRAELGDDYQDIRRRAFSLGIRLTNNKKDPGLDVWNDDMASILPGLFDSEETDMRSMLERMLDIAEEGRDEHMSLADYTARLAGEERITEQEALDNLDRQMDLALRIFAGNAQLETEVKQWAIQERGGTIRENIRLRAKLAAQKDERREMAAQQRQRAEVRELQERSMKQLRWLRKNRRKAPEEMQAAFDEVLGDIDLMAINEPGEQYKQTWERVIANYKKAKESDPNWLPSAELEKVISRIDGTKIAELDVDALENLYRAAVGLRTEFYDRNNVLGDELHRMFDEVFDDSKRELMEAPVGIKNKKLLNRLFNIEQLTPMNVMQRMVGWNPNSTFYSMAKQMEKGERDVRAYTVKATRELEEFLNNHQEWVKKADGQGEDAVWYEVEVPELVQLGHGDKPIFGPAIRVWMTPAQKVHMYLESKNYNNLAHMAGGRTFVNKELYQKGERQEAFAQGITIKMAPETVKNLTSDLTAEEMELAKLLEHYYNETARVEVNRVSNILYGYDKAVTKDYAPIISNQNYTHSEIGQFDASAEGVGSMKERIQGSKNPSYNISAFDAWERHVDHTARFVGMAIPTRNWTTFLNWYSGRESTKEMITQKWGQEGLDYITNILTTLQSGVSGDASGRGFRSETGQIPDKIMSNYISAVFGANPSIVLKQLGSIPLASAYLGMENMPSIQQRTSIDRGLIAKYTQELDWRTMGYSMPETRQLKENPNWSQTNKPVQFVFGGGAITAMDGWAASILWPWAENKVRKEHPELRVGSQEQIDAGQSPFYMKVAEEFNDAVSRSQSVSDEMHQGELRKNKNPVVKAFTMFRSDSAQTYNALRQMIGEAQYYKRAYENAQAVGNADAIAEMKKKAGARKKAVGATVIALFVNSLWAEGIDFLMNLWKYKGRSYEDEDEEELTFGRVVGEMAKGMVGSMAGVMTFGEELAELIGVVLLDEKAQDIDSLALEQLNAVIEVVTTGLSSTKAFMGDAADIVKNDGDLKVFLKDRYPDILGGIKETAQAAAMYIGGLPAKNVEAYLVGVMKWFLPELEADYQALMGEVDTRSLDGLKGPALEERVENILSRNGMSENEETAKALAALYEAGFTASVPRDAPADLTINGEKHELSAYDQQAYAMVIGDLIGKSLDELVACEEFQNATDEQKVKMLDYLYDYAADNGKTEFAMHRELGEIEVGNMTTSISGMKAVGLEPVDCIRIKMQQNIFTEMYEDNNVDKAVAFSEWIDQQSWTPEQLQSIEDHFPYQKKAMEKLEKYEDMGFSMDTADRILEAVEALSPMEGQKSVTWSQKLRAVADLNLSEEEQIQAMISVTPGSYESSIRKINMLKEYGVSSTTWLDVKEATWSFDENGNGSIDQGEMTAVLDAWGGAMDNLLVVTGNATPLSNRDKAILWQLQNASWKPKRNPYDEEIGQEIYDKLNKKD